MSRRTTPRGADAAKDSTLASNASSPWNHSTFAENDPDLWQLSKEEVAEATENFAPANLLGEGGFSLVYRGLLYGTDVAVKQLKPSAIAQDSLWREVSTLARLRHPHIMLLIGCCAAECSVITEFMPGGSLQDRICRRKVPRPSPLHWVDRFRIAREMSSGLLHMHLRNILHRDLKPENVLLDRHNVSKLADVGLARLYLNNKSTIVSDAQGMFGFVDPYHQRTGELTKQSDVYALGLVILQLFTGIGDIAELHEVLSEVEEHVDQKQASEALSALLAEMDGLSEQNASTQALKNLAESIQKAMARSASRWAHGVDKAVDNLMVRLDPEAGDWPELEARAVLKLALQCVERLRDLRPDLEADMVPQLYALANATEQIWERQRKEQQEQPGGSPQLEQAGGDRSAGNCNGGLRSEGASEAGPSSSATAAAQEEEPPHEAPPFSTLDDSAEARARKPEVNEESAHEEQPEKPPEAVAQPLSGQPSSGPASAAGRLTASLSRSPVVNHGMGRKSLSASSAQPPPDPGGPLRSGSGGSDVFGRQGEQQHWARRWGWLQRQRRLGLSGHWEDRFYALYRDPVRLSCFKALPMLHNEAPEKEYLLGPSIRVVDKGRITQNGKDIYCFSIHGIGHWPLVLGCSREEEAEGWIRNIQQSIAAEGASGTNQGRSQSGSLEPQSSATWKNDRPTRPVCICDITVPSKEVEGSAGSEEEVSASALAPGKDGMLWASIGSSITGWKGDILMVTSQEDDSMGAISALVVDMEGSLWSGSQGGVIKKWWWEEAGLSLVAIASSCVGEGITVMVAASDGTIWSAHGATIETWKHQEGKATCQSLTTFRVHSDTVEALVVGPDGRVWSGANDGTVRAWRQGQGCVITIDASIGPVVALAMGPDGTLWAGGRDGHVIGWKDRKCVVQIEGHTEIQPRALAAAPNGMLWSGHDDSTIKAWREGKCVATLLDHDDRVLALAMSEDGTLWSSSADATIKGWRSA